MSRWKSFKEFKPSTGQDVLVLHMNGEKDPDFWTTEVAYYCDGGFYYLEYDPNLGIMRKQFMTEPVDYWTQYLIPDMSELK